MSQIPQLMSGRTLEHGIALAVDHGGPGASKMYVGGQANADVAASSTHGGDSEATTETALAELKIPADALVAEIDFGLHNEYLILQAWCPGDDETPCPDPP